MKNQSEHNYHVRFKEYFANINDEELINAFNREVGNNGWVNARALYLFEMKEEFEKRFDCSEIRDKISFSIARKIKLIGKKVIKI
jgi:hypothetical protein